ncbi:fasciclin domain-containing protein, partial [Croceitalea dokdonensis]|uniref:fasciclin domain-containing protein n=1 Tax=Croceitalea dokdonensis TaxID=346188 RepID=UPI000B227B6A
MKVLLHIKKYLLLLGVLAFAFSCDKDEEGTNTTSREDATSNIVEIAQGENNLTSLVAALLKAGENENIDLVGTLNGEGPFTVFAPTNEAFAALLAELDGFDSLEDFDTAEEQELLAEILSYHVVAGVAALSGDLTEGQEIETVQGEKVTVSLEGGVFINDSEVSQADIMAINGIVHVINKVLVPQSVLQAMNMQDLVDLVVATDTLSALEAAVIKADLVETLKGEGPFTVFAPTDDAFAGLLMALGGDYNSLDDFDTEDEINLLREILLYHVIPAKVLAADLAEGEVATALEGASLSIIPEGETFVIGDASDVNANITGTDIMASNGVAHTIDKVLLTPAAVDLVANIQMRNIVEIAVETDDLSLLVDALTAANAGL